MVVAVFPDPASPELTEALRVAGIRMMSIADAAHLIERRPPEGWWALVVELGDDDTRGWSLARRARDQGVRVLLAAPRELAGRLEGGACDDFVLTPLDPVELSLRLHRLLPAVDLGEVLQFKDLELNTATYQATLGGRPIDMTYMEYELLRFLVANPVRVWSREQLLSNVWGYDYFGGARTVDVHVRRLRAKLGEERASWITTVRSVGYRLG